MIKIKCRIKDVKFYNSSNGFMILNVIYDKKSAIVLGISTELRIGEVIECSGNWVMSKKHGEQFKAEKIIVTLPDEELDIKEYLEQGLIRGIGPSLAKRIINIYGKHFFEVLEQSPNDLLKVEGIGIKKLETILSSWKERQYLPEIKKNLESYGFEFSHILKLYKNYGSEVMMVLNTRPYSIISEMPEMGFKSIDNFALRNGFEKNNPSRIMSGFIEVLKTEEYGKSNTMMAEKEFTKASAKLLQLHEKELISYVDQFINEDVICRCQYGEESYIQSFEAFKAEEYIATKLSLMSLENKKDYGAEEYIKHLEEKENFKLTSEQRDAIKISVQNKISIITGGPGVGKTTVLNFLLKILKNKGESVMLCAPTGRAAQRMTESTGEESLTIHRALGYNPQYEDFEKNELNTFEADNLIIDEVSMIDLYLMKSLLRAIKRTTRIVLIGDVNQIASIGSGAVLKDLLDSKKIPYVSMVEIHRQAVNSKITLNAYRINEGKFVLPNNKNEKEDFYFIKTKNDLETLEKLKFLVTDRIPKGFNVSPKENIQILTPIHDGILGTKNLNNVMQSLLNPLKDNSLTMKRGAYEYRINDNIIQNKNNYEKMIFNGDMGVIDYISYSNLSAIFNEKEMLYEKSEVDEISLSYAKTLHKSQGSEYNVIIIPISHSYKYMLDRSLIYTGVTRGKLLVILIGSIVSLKKGIANENSRNRLTDLKRKLIESV
jgi:exodeoxyribonuclease V alpha subunit